MPYADKDSVDVYNKWQAKQKINWKKLWKDAAKEADSTSNGPAQRKLDRALEKDAKKQKELGIYGKNRTRPKKK